MDDENRKKAKKSSAGFAILYKPRLQEVLCRPRHHNMRVKHARLPNHGLQELIAGAVQDTLHCDQPLRDRHVDFACCAPSTVCREVNRDVEIRGGHNLGARNGLMEPPKRHACW
jgi:hypothetical protein